MADVLIQPLLLGLSVGIFCFSYCLPFIAPYMVFEERQKKENFRVILKFISGRLFGYLAFGGFFGYLGQKINNATLDLLLTSSLLFLSLILIFYALGLLKEKKGFCFGPKIKNKTPLIMGFLMGINVCPPFLMSLSYVFTLKSWFSGLLFFSVFFLGTTIYFLPLTFLGFLNKIEEFRKLARVSAILVGLIFLIYSSYSIYLELRNGLLLQDFVLGCGFEKVFRQTYFVSMPQNFFFASPSSQNLSGTNPFRNSRYLQCLLLIKS